MSLSPRKMFVLTGGGPENYLGGAHAVLEVNCSFLFLFIPLIIMCFFFFFNSIVLPKWTLFSVTNLCFISYNYLAPTQI